MLYMLKMVMALDTRKRKNGPESRSGPQVAVTTVIILNLMPADTHSR